MADLSDICSDCGCFTGLIFYICTGNMMLSSFCVVRCYVVNIGTENLLNKVVLISLILLSSGPVEAKQRERDSTCISSHYYKLGLGKLTRYYHVNSLIT